MSTLDRYLEEREEQSPVEEREFQIENNPRLDKLVKTYERWLEVMRTYKGPKTASDLAEDSLQENIYSAEDIGDFSLRLKAYEEHEYFAFTGIFLGYLTEHSDEKSFTIITEHLENPISLLGYQNSKELTILGDAGNHAGWFMDSGKLVITGDVADDAGNNLSGGTIIIEGSAGEYTGEYMCGGTINVKGSIRSISEYFLGGEILEGGVVKCSKKGRDWKRWAQ